MKLFTKMSSWLLLAVMGLIIFPNTSIAQNKNISGSVSVYNAYVSGTTTTLNCNLTYTSPDAEWADDLTLTFPAGFTINSASTINGKSAVITGQEVFWDVQYTSSNVNEDFTVEVSADASVLGVQTIAYVCNGDGWGGAPHFFEGTVNVNQASPKLTIAPLMLDLGEWPIDGWQEMAYYEVVNEGTGIVDWTASELDDPDGLFALMNPNPLPDLPEGGTPAMVGVSFVGSGVAEDMYTATYVASWGSGKSVTTADVMVAAYDAPVGDIVENPHMIALPFSQAGESSAFPMRSNYNIPGTATNGKDVVYMFTLAEDNEVSVTISNATETPKMAIYAAGFEGEGGPMVSNALAYAGATAANLPLFAGDYYLVVAAENDDAAMTYDLDITASVMPDPECVMDPMPTDGQIDVPSNGIVLEWTFGQFAQEYQVAYGTQYPPTDFTSDWMLVDGATEGSFALPNLDPSMQYFWMVNVKNNNATVLDCDVYGFTTTITPPSNLTAEVIENAEDDYDVQLSWTSAAKALLGYNVYRSDDGVTYNMINTSLVTATSYLDEDLAYNTDPCYEYYVEAVFDEGTSDKSNYASACITGVGTIDGVVTELLTGNPIMGASVKLVSETGGRSYDLITGVVGEYSAEVLEDCYTVTASMEGYITEVRTGVCIDYNTTVTEDFELDEFPYPVSDVVATELDESTVQVDWGNNNGGGGNEVEFRYDDGTATGQLGFTGGTVNSVLGNLHAVDAELTAMSWYLTAEGGPHANINIYVLGLDGSGMPDGTNVLYSATVPNTDEQWNMHEFEAPVVATGGFFLCVGYNGFAGLGTDDGVDDPYTFVNGTHYFASDYTAGGFATWESVGFANNGMIRAMGTETGKASFASNPTPEKIKAPRNLVYSQIPTTFTGTPNWNRTETASADKDLMGYNVWRGPCYSDDPADFEFLGYTLDDQFTDNNWGDVDWGVFKWSVEAVYTNNTSEMAFSNCLDKDMETTVGVEVTTNSGDNPEGCEILFVNTSEPDMMIEYEIELDATGIGSVDPFRKGVYDYSVILPGFGEIYGEDILIDSDTVFVWQLEELLAPPTDLYVTPTGFATWRGGGAIPFEPYMTSFDEGLPEGWEVIVGGTSSDSWFWTTDDGGSTLDGTPFMFIDSDGAGSGVFMDEYLVSPVIDASNADELWVQFDQYFNQGWDAAAYGDIDVYDGNDWVTIQHQAGSDLGAWGAPDVPMLDVTEYANDEFRVRFHYSATWDWYWAVDNFMVHDNSGKYAGKEFQFYKIWHDEVFSNDVDTNFYQYGTNPEVDILVPGETYLAEVAALYSTGLSAKSMYEWTYLPCDSFPSFVEYDAYNIEGSNDNLVIWTDMASAPDDYMEGFEGDFPPAGWMKANPDGGTGWEALAVGTSPLPGWTGGEATACPDGGSQMAFATWTTGGASSNDQWLISPMLSAFTDFELSFYMECQYGDSYMDNVDVLISTTGTDPADFDIVVEEITFTSADGWLLYTYNLTDLGLVESGTPFYVAFREHVSDNFFDGAAIMLDNFFYGAAGKKAIPESVATTSVGGRDLAYVHNPAPDAPYQYVDVKNMKDGYDVLGANIYRDGEMIAFVAVPDTFYLDMDLEPGYYDYCVAKVYTEDEGLHSWTSCVDGACIEDVLVPEDCYAPENLTAEDLLGDGYTATLNWEFGGADVQEFRYDDGTATGQLGFTGGTTSSVLGAAHPQGAEITELSWYLTAEGGPHTNVQVYIMGLDGSGMPDGNNVLWTQSLSNVDETWNTYTLDTPVAADGGFFLCVGYNGFAGLGTDDGVGDTYTFVTGTHFYASDYSAGGWATWESVGFANNAMIRAMGVPGSVASYPVVETTAIESDLNMVEMAPVVTGEPKWTESADKEFVGFTVYRDGEEIVSGLTETTYADDLGEYMGEVCYEVTAVYSVCGESDPSNEACVSPGVGIGEMDNNVAVYPNPAKDFVMVEASSDIRSIEVTNYMGQVVSAVKSVEMTQFRINTSDLSSGVYFVEVETAAGIETVRIVISE